MSHLVSDLIEFACVRLGSGMTLHRVPACARRVCEGVLDEMRAVFPDRAFLLRGDAGVPGEWDADRLAQVVSNLVGNAVQHGASNSPVTVTARSVGGGIEVTVHNEGAPIPPDRVPRLFDSFYRPDGGNDATHTTSLGLGLYIAREIVLAHGGTMEVRSSDDEGTTFAVFLPSTPEAGKTGD